MPVPVARARAALTSQVQADRQRREIAHGEIDRIAEQWPAGGNGGRRSAVERHDVLAARLQAVAPVGERDARSTDSQRFRAVLVREAQPYTRAADAQAHDLAHGLIV